MTRPAVAFNSGCHEAAIGLILGSREDLNLMRAACYVRKSTAQDGRAESDKSVADQERECRALIAANGWTLDAAHVYADDGVSGALFGEGRPGFHKLLEAVKAGAKAKRLPFDVLVLSDGDRLGRDRIRTDYHTLEILDTGVRIFFANGQERKVGNATDGMMMTFAGYAAEVERERAAERTRSKMYAKARNGELTGSIPLGYDAVAVDGHKILRINDPQAEVVRRIFELSAQGHGITAIAHLLNREHRGLRKFSATGVRDMLHNPVYVGQIVYGKKRLIVKGGKTVRVFVPESEWVRVEKPELRIVPDTLWRQVEQRHATIFSGYLRGKRGRLQGRPESRADNKYLLSSMVVCGVCGGRMVVWSISKPNQTYRYLRCWRARSRGAAACTNNRSVNLQDLTSVIIHHFKSDVLTPKRIAQISRDLAADAATSPEKIAAVRARLDAEDKQIGNRLARLTEAIVAGGTAKTLVEAIKVAEAEQRALESRRAALDGTQQALASWTAEGHDERVRVMLGDWQAALEGEPVVARQILRKLLTSPITVTPNEEDGGISYSATGSYARAISGTLGGDDPTMYTIRQRGIERADDLAVELKTLAAAQLVRPSDGSRGPTS